MTITDEVSSIPIDEIIGLEPLTDMCQVFADCFSVRIQLSAVSGEMIVDCVPKTDRSRNLDLSIKAPSAQTEFAVIDQSRHLANLCVSELDGQVHGGGHSHQSASTGTIQGRSASRHTVEMATSLTSSLILAYRSAARGFREREQNAIAAQVLTQELQVANEALETRNAALAANLNRLRELDDLKSQFLATVSHELRTPLTSVMGYSDMLLDGYGGELNVEQAEYVQIIRERGQTLLEMIDNLLKISVIQRGGASIDLEQCALDTLVEDALATLRPTALKRDIHLNQSIEPDLPEIQIDVQKIRQVLLNLIGNAVKFTGAAGQVTVALSRTRLPTGDQQGTRRSPKYGIKVSVQDTGKGIERQHLIRIFDAFYQVDNSVTREYGGAGLGLSIAKNFVEAHGGRIEVFSRMGQGSTFSFAIPLTQV
ncbi:MAG: HAMP domain-containing sensor histidine kinase [Myxococcota bacterium]|nr:HAMP domain-containing sensor histidine kinase [Myxococcota bacterium]